MKKNHNQFCKNALYFLLGALLSAGSAIESRAQTLSSGLSVKKLPVLSMLPVAGYYKKTITVLLETRDMATPAPLIYYTLDKSRPDKTAKLYNPQQPFTLSESALVSAIAVDAGGVASEVVRQLYTIEVDKKAPVLSVSPPGGRFLMGVHVSLSATDDQDSDPHIFYTRNGQDPIPGANATELVKKGKIWFGPDTKDSILKVIARDDQMNTTPVQTFRFKFVPTGFTEINNDWKIKVFPSPATDCLHIEVSGVSNVTMTYSVKDVLGQEMISGALGSSGMNTRLETSHWPEGFYMLNISNGHSAFVQKISISH